MTYLETKQKFLVTTPLSSSNSKVLSYKSCSKLLTLKVSNKRKGTNECVFCWVFFDYEFTTQSWERKNDGSAVIKICLILTMLLILLSKISKEKLSIIRIFLQFTQNQDLLGTFSLFTLASQSLSAFPKYSLQSLKKFSKIISKNSLSQI